MSDLRLAAGSRVGVLGGGPAGSLFSYFLLEHAQRAGLPLDLTIHEWRDFSTPGPAGCNMCGGIVSESLVQNLATDGITLPPTVVERGIASYVLHMDVGSVRIDTPLEEKRIAAVHRGAGPKGMKAAKWRSFDGYLLDLAVGKGARVVRGKVDEVSLVDGRPTLKGRTGEAVSYDLLAVAAGVNSGVLGGFEKLGLKYRVPGVTRTYIADFYLGQETITALMGTSMHVFLLNLPRLEFAALIPKGDYATMCLLGEEIDDALVRAFLTAPEVKKALPPGWEMPKDFCHCSPKINVRGAFRPYADRMVFLGDAGVSRLFKDGIGAAYRTAKAAARTAMFEGVGEADFRAHFEPTCRKIAGDNRVGKFMFAVTRIIQGWRTARVGMIRMVAREQFSRGGKRRMSTVLWDMFTGSAPYKEIFARTLNPFYLARLAWETAAGRFRGVGGMVEAAGAALLSEVLRVSASGALGKLHPSGEVVFKEGDSGDCMYVIQSGEVEILKDGVRLAVLSNGSFFGEMALFANEARSATVRALGDARLLTIDRNTLLQRIHGDPSLAYRIVESLSGRFQQLTQRVNPGQAAAPAPVAPEKVYAAGEVLCAEGDPGHGMLIVQQGKVELVKQVDGSERREEVLSKGDFFGEMSMFAAERRMATVRALSEVRVLPVTGATLLQQINGDPSLACRLIESMSRRIRTLNQDTVRIASPAPGA